jgi:hypothetical protein
MVLILVIAVVMVSFQPAPGLSIALLVSILPALVVTEIRASRRRHHGLPMSGIEKIVWVVALTVLIPVLLVVALAIALFAFCALSAR